MHWLLLTLLLTSSAYAQPIGGGGGCNSPYGATGIGCAPGSGSVTQASSAPAAPTYTGPVDIVAAPSECYSLRACSATLAGAGATTTAVVDVRGAITTTSCTIYLIGNGTGGLDLTTTGAGGVSNQCLLGATTFCTVTNTSCTVSKLYGQTGSHTVVQATVGSQPIFTFNCVNTSLPCLQGDGARLLSGSFAGAALPLTLSTVFERLTGGSGNTFGLNNAILGADSTANQSYFFYINEAFGTASDNVLHAYQGVLATTGNGIINVDGVQTAGTGVGGGGTTMSVLGTGAFQMLTGYWTEGLIYPIAFTTTQQNNMHANQSAYWGTP